MVGTAGGPSVILDVTDGGGGGVDGVICNGCGAEGALPLRLRDLMLFALIVSESELEELSLRVLDRSGWLTSTSRSGGRPGSDFSASDASPLPSAPTPVDTPSNHLRMLLRLSPQFLQLESPVGGTGGCAWTSVVVVTVVSGSTDDSFGTGEADLF